MTAVHAGPSPSEHVAWSDPAFARIAGLVHTVAGLVFPENRRASAETGMRRAMTAAGLADAAALADAAERPGEVRDALLAELTVGETYFFREPAQLEALRTHVLPALRAAGRSSAPIRIWSAGCASGEEPYTLAMLLREQGWAGTTRILGTDVSRPRLEAAQRGRYTRWSMRGASAERVARWFTPRRGHFQLSPDIQSSVEFATLNLVADDYPSSQSGTTEQDVVFCRNVLIYFDMATVERIATRLLASLAPDGWLFLGASDPMLVGLVPCEAMTLSGGIAYRRAGRPGAVVVSMAQTPAARITYERRADAVVELPAPHPRPAIPAPVVSPPVAPSEARDASGESPDDAEQWIALVRADADAGRLREAEDACIRALDSFRLSPELHYLHGMLLSAAGRGAEAAKAARRALYLDGHLVMARLLLGDSLARLGDADGATRAFETVLAELAGVDDAAIMPAGHGTPASAARRVAELRLAALRGSQA